MPLPLPNLDTRRWADLIEEGRALIPRYAPDWTDHNIHDPGITLMELLAYRIEQMMYRANRVPEQHRRKFLALMGFLPRPPCPAETVLSFTLKAGITSQRLPKGLRWMAARRDNIPLPFVTACEVILTEAAIQKVQVEDESGLTNVTRLWLENLPIAMFGRNPSEGAAFYIGFDRPLPLNQPVTLWLGLEKPDAEARQHILEAVCLPRPPLLQAASCDAETEIPPAEISIVLPEHHTVRLAWEYYDGAAWQVIEQVEDETHSATLSGAVSLTLPADMQPYQESFYLRCRIVNGVPDAAPVLHRLVLNAVRVYQKRPVIGQFPIAAGVTLPEGQTLTVGQTQRLLFRLDGGRITSLEVSENGIEGLVIAYQPATDTDDGLLTLNMVLVGTGSESPQQIITLPNAPVADGQAQLFLQTPSGWLTLQQRPDLDASTGVDFMLDATTGNCTFGDGQRGHLLPLFAPVLARYAITEGAAGSILSGASWSLLDDDVNRMLLGEAVADAVSRIQSAANPDNAHSGTNAESLESAAGRAAASFWSHERLLEFAGKSITLDQLDRQKGMALTAPLRATTVLDFERLALDVPGTQVARARAWAGIDPTYPCLQAPGTVTVVIVPHLPLGRPMPSPGLLRAVKHYLNRRRVVGTRLVVVAPTYTQVAVRAKVKSKSGVNVSRVQEAILKNLNRFLDPLIGGAEEKGWPFGRDVYRAEILQLIDGVAGVDHVLFLELVADGADSQCDNLCVGLTSLVTPGSHEIEVL